MLKSHTRTNQERLLKISSAFKCNETLLAEDQAFLADALEKIACGEDANAVLGTIGQRGKRKNAHHYNTKILLKYLMPWITAATASETNGGLNLKTHEATHEVQRLLAENFQINLDPDTIRKYYNQHKKENGLHFEL